MLYGGFTSANNSYVIVEVKGDNMIDDLVVKAKSQFAKQIAVASGMEYRIIKGSDVMDGLFGTLIN